VRRKGLDQLLEALARPGCGSIHLAVIGSGPEEERLRSLARDLSIENRVHFLGRVDEDRKWAVLRSADLYLSASMHEGFGLVYLEAMTAGLPVITPNEGGQSDFLEDGKTGYLVPPGDVDELAKVMARAAAGREELRAMGAQNRGRAEEFRIDRVALRYERLFESILRPKAGPMGSTARAW
jgi:glycosyltransferase involved in cell wall biosynthesis